jgi:hypothetical protein
MTKTSKTNRAEFNRDFDTNALINIDMKGYVNYKDQKVRSNRINSMEQELTEMKTILNKLLDRADNNGN